MTQKKSTNAGKNLSKGETSHPFNFSFIGTITLKQMECTGEKRKVPKKSNSPKLVVNMVCREVLSSAKQPSSEINACRDTCMATSFLL
jgi:hypothetical protein